jgi:phosphoglycolate phosphatase-like HAD superfamily hydrolase
MTSAARSTLVLWDIDGTLVDVRGAGRRSFALALEKAWGVVDDLAGVKFAGATDLMVLEELRARLALDPSGDARFFDAMARILGEQLASSPALALPGAIDVVTALRSRGAAQGLVTGNAARCAFTKLQSAGIDTAAFVAGGYGDEHADRMELAVRAKSRCGERFDRVVLVGDTPSDVKAAKHIGAVAVGVVGRAYSREQLSAAGADVVIDSLLELRV